MMNLGRWRCRGGTFDALNLVVKSISRSLAKQGIVRERNVVIDNIDIPGIRPDALPPMIDAGEENIKGEFFIQDVLLMEGD